MNFTDITDVIPMLEQDLNFTNMTHVIPNLPANSVIDALDDVSVSNTPRTRPVETPDDKETFFNPSPSAPIYFSPLPTPRSSRSETQKITGLSSITSTTQAELAVPPRWLTRGQKAILPPETTISSPDEPTFVKNIKSLGEAVVQSSDFVFARDSGFEFASFSRRSSGAAALPEIPAPPEIAPWITREKGKAESSPASSLSSDDEEVVQTAHKGWHINLPQRSSTKLSKAQMPSNSFSLLESLKSPSATGSPGRPPWFNPLFHEKTPSTPDSAGSRGMMALPRPRRSRVLVRPIPVEHFRVERDEFQGVEASTHVPTTFFGESPAARGPVMRRLTGVGDALIPAAPPPRRRTKRPKGHGP